MKKTIILYWTFTVFFGAFMLFSAIPDILVVPEAAAFITNLGYPSYLVPFLGWAKLLGVIAILIPGFPRIKEWAYAGFAITLGSALVAHLSVGDGPEAWGFAAGTGVLWALSYYLWRPVQA